MNERHRTKLAPPYSVTFNKQVRSHSFAFVLAFSLAVSHRSDAGVFQRCADPFIRTAKDQIVDRLVDNSEGQFKLLTDLATGKQFVVKLGKLLGTGWYGAVYRVEGTNHPRIKIDPSIPLVVKIPHSLNLTGSGRPIGKTAEANRREIRLYGFLNKRVRKIAKAAKFPKDPAWSKDHLPLVQQVDSVETESGTLIFKYEVKGTTLKDIGKGTAENLPTEAEMKKSLRDIYDLTQAIHQSVKIRNWRGRWVGFSLDIRHTNLIWISEKATLDLFGFKEAGFLLMEMDMTLNNVNHYIDPNTSFEDYFREFKNYVASESQR